MKAESATTYSQKTAMTITKATVISVAKIIPWPPCSPIQTPLARASNASSKISSPTCSVRTDGESNRRACKVKRGGRRDLTARVSGVSVQKPRYLELLLQNPWDGMIATDDPTPGVRRILVPNAAAFPV